MARRVELRRGTRGTTLAAAVAAALLAGAGCGSDDNKSDRQQAQLRCLGANECAAMSECAGGPGGGECAGMNECMGQGWIYSSTKAECEEKGGMVQEA